MEILKNSPQEVGPAKMGRNSQIANPVGVIHNSREMDLMGTSHAKGNAITAIKPAVRDTRRVNVFVDGKFKFSLDIAQMADFKLKVGQVLTEEKLEELVSASNFGKLYQRTLEYVFLRPHSVKEVRDYLKKKQRARQLQARRYEEFRGRLRSSEDFWAKNSGHSPAKPGAAISDRDIEMVIERLIE